MLSKFIYKKLGDKVPNFSNFFIQRITLMIYRLNETFIEIENIWMEKQQNDKWSTPKTT